MSIKNSCRFIGRTGGEIEIKHFEGGNSVGTLSLAVDDSYKDQNGVKVEKTVWVNLVVRNKKTEVFEKYVPKGSKITVDCVYQPRSWDADDGSKRYAHEFSVIQVDLPPKPQQ